MCHSPRLSGDWDLHRYLLRAWLGHCWRGTRTSIWGPLLKAFFLREWPSCPPRPLNRRLLSAQMGRSSEVILDYKSIRLNTSSSCIGLTFPLLALTQMVPWSRCWIPRPPSMWTPTRTDDRQFASWRTFAEPLKVGRVPMVRGLYAVLDVIWQPGTILPHLLNGVIFPSQES